MRRTPFKAKRDANEAELFAILRGHGLDVEATDKPLDAIVGYGGKTYLVEIKDGPDDSDRVKSDRWWSNYLERNDSFVSDLFALTGLMCPTSTESMKDRRICQVRPFFRP